MTTSPFDCDDPSLRRHGGHHIKAWRKYRKLSVPELAARINEKPGVSASMIAQLEQGRAGYTQKTLEKIARGLDLEPWQLLAGEPREYSAFWHAAFRQSAHSNVYFSFAESDRPLFEKMISINFSAALEAAVEQANLVLKKQLGESSEEPSSGF
jgi:transcriptional regulator with XRE-family HTH domain